MKRDKRLTKEAILLKIPLDGHTPEDVRQWLEEKNSADAALADAMAEVKKKVGWLHHELNDPDNAEITIAALEVECTAWCDLEKELVMEIVRRLELLNATRGTTFRTTGNGWHYIIKPFMESNGYRDSAGWWVGKEVE